MLDYYFSGTPSFRGEMMAEMSTKCSHRLLSCYRDYVKYAHSWIELTVQRNHPQTLLLDSGAFTAWNKGAEVTIDELLKTYYDFMNRYWDKLPQIWLINLDKIPGSPGVTASDAEVEEAIEISDRNFEILVSHFGPRVLPVYHQGESEARMHEVCRMSEYICVSPRNDLPEGQRVTWAQEAHSKLPKGIKTHGLATTGENMMVTVPWKSVDSASWVFTCAMGNITICLNGSMKNIGVSSQSPTRFEANQHVSNMNPLYRKAVEDRIEELGYSYEVLSVDHNARMAITMLEIIEWNKKYHKSEIIHREGLFDL